MARTTQRQLDGHLKVVAGLLGREVGYRIPGALYLESGPGGQRLYEVTEDGRGAHERSPRLPAGEMWTYLYGMAEALRMIGASAASR